MILADPLKHADLIEDMKKLAEDANAQVQYTAGGAGLNSLRCAQVQMRVYEGMKDCVTIHIYIYLLAIVATDAGK